MLWPMVLLALAFSVPSSKASFMTPGYLDPNAGSCPLEKAMDGFDMTKFLGDWYVLEYEYTSKMKMKDLSCVGFKFSLTGLGDLVSNFTFRFPPKTGFFYHVPTFSTVSDLDNAVWETNFKRVELVSVVLDTDYSRWAVLAQCSQGADKDLPKFLSTRILSRSRDLGDADWDRVRASIREANVAAPHKYSVQQSDCNETD